MKTLRSLWLEPVLKDLQDRDNNDFMMLESRLRSAYIKLDSDFRKETPGPKSLCSNLAYLYDLVGLVLTRNTLSQKPREAVKAQQRE